MNKNERPETTLFLLMSVDGKISTGDTDEMDVDKDYRVIDEVKEGLQQYYDLEQKTDLFSLNTGRVFAKIGVNEKEEREDKTPASFVVIDSKPHLTSKGIRYLVSWAKKIFIVTTNPNHPAIALREEYFSLEVFLYEGEIDFGDVFSKLKGGYGADKLTIQSGGTLNSFLVRNGFVDHLSIVVTPVLVGGANTSTLIDGESLHSKEDLFKLKTLKLIGCDKLENSYLHLRYDVVDG